ncbi:hypothetical protein B0T13DRAFT_463971 [Neurospora crassa]|nr:hypothetical protein B0T13DRAFT_463971 [Neurospora crassa]
MRLAVSVIFASFDIDCCASNLPTSLRGKGSLQKANYRLRGGATGNSAAGGKKQPHTKACVHYTSVPRILTINCSTGRVKRRYVPDP